MKGELRKGLRREGRLKGIGEKKEDAPVGEKTDFPNLPGTTL